MTPAQFRAQSAAWFHGYTTGVGKGSVPMSSLRNVALGFTVGVALWALAYGAHMWQ